MSVEAIVMRSLKESEHGVRFTQTVQQILETIVERILLEDIDGGQFLEKVGVVLHHYVEFNLMEALKTYGELRPSLTDFAISVNRDQESSEIRRRTWVKIVDILAMLASDGVRFLAIAAEGVGQIRRI